MTNKTYFTSIELQELPKLLSTPRFNRYLVECGNDTARALALYQWNLEVSGEFLKILHLCEIGLRNGISYAVERLPNK